MKSYTSFVEKDVYFKHTFKLSIYYDIFVCLPGYDVFNFEYYEF